MTRDASKAALYNSLLACCQKANHKIWKRENQIWNTNVRTLSNKLNFEQDILPFVCVPDSTENVLKRVFGNVCLDVAPLETCVWM